MSEEARDENNEQKRKTVRGGESGRALRTLGDDDAYLCTNHILVYMPRQHKYT